MSHKVHPKIFRIRETADWDSRWFSKKNIAKHLEEDYRIREYLDEKLNECGCD